MIPAVLKWVGQDVNVTLQATVPTPITGKLLQIDDSGLLLEMQKGQTFVPMTSVLHVSLVN